MTALRRGRLVWVELPDPQGRNPKVRPAVILTPTDLIRPDGVVQVAAVTSAIGQAPRDAVVELPWHPSGAVKTKLTLPSEVVCTWLAEVPVANVSDSGGFVSGATLLAIVSKTSPPDLPPPANPPA